MMEKGTIVEVEGENIKRWDKMKKRIKTKDKSVKKENRRKKENKNHKLMITPN